MGKTEENLQAGFAGESQARNMYTYFAGVARKEGYHYIAKIFEETAENELRHAKDEFKLLNGIGDTIAITVGNSGEPESQKFITAAKIGVAVPIQANLDLMGSGLYNAGDIIGFIIARVVPVILTVTVIIDTIRNPVVILPVVVAVIPGRVEAGHANLSLHHKQGGARILLHIHHQLLGEL